MLLHRRVIPSIKKKNKSVKCTIINLHFILSGIVSGIFYVPQMSQLHVPLQHINTEKMTVFELFMLISN